MTDPELCEWLAAHGIVYRRFEHPAVYTCEEAARLVPAEATGVHTKNLFLRDKKGRRHWLLVTTCEKAVDLKALAAAIGADTLSLASPDRLARLLGVTPGAVTVLALVNDTAHDVDVLIDRDVSAAERLRSHPLVNTATLVLERAGLERFLGLTGHRPALVEVTVRVTAAPPEP
jgi:Ala-tRNA(Pro) deacylase